MGVLRESKTFDFASPPSGNEFTFEKDYSGHEVTISMESKNLDGGTSRVQIKQSVDGNKFSDDPDGSLNGIGANDTNIFELSGKGSTKYKVLVTPISVTSGELIFHVVGVN